MIDSGLLSALQLKKLSMLALRGRRKRCPEARARTGSGYATPGKDALADGTALIVECGDPPPTMRAYPSSADDSVTVADPMHAYYATFGATLENPHPAAESLGLGVVWISLDPGMEQTLRELIAIPTQLEMVFTCPMGTVSQSSTVPTHRTLEDIVHWKKYDPARERDEEQDQHWLEVERVAGWKGR